MGIVVHRIVNCVISHEKWAYIDDISVYYNFNNEGESIIRNIDLHTLTANELQTLLNARRKFLYTATKSDYIGFFNAIKNIIYENKN